MSIQVTATMEGLDVLATGGRALNVDLLTQLAALTEAAGLARLSWNDEVVAQRVPPTIAMGRAKVSPPPGAFLQATEHGQSVLTQAMRNAVATAGRVVDLFAGCGTFALPLAETAEVHAVEAAPEMLAALDHGWRHARGLKHVTTEVRDLFRNPLVGQELKGFDAAVLDPPRAGAQAQVGELAEAQVPLIGYVSCNPVSFARDVKILIDAGYQMAPVQVVDQFRWSAHVELAAALRLAHM